MNTLEAARFWTEYQTATQETAIYPGQRSSTGLIYTALGLAGEVGEVCDQVKKVMRDDGNVLTSERLVKLSGELGDVLWYLARAARELEIDLGEVVLDTPSEPVRRAVPGNGTPTGLAFVALGMFRCAARFGDGVMAVTFADAARQRSLADTLSPLLTDVFYTANLFAKQLDRELADVAVANREKLLSRLERGVLGGSGSNR